MKTLDAMTMLRPATLQDVAARTLAGEPFDHLLSEFLDMFYGAKTGDDAGQTAADAPTGDGQNG